MTKWLRRTSACD